MKTLSRLGRLLFVAVPLLAWPIAAGRAGAQEAPQNPNMKQILVKHGDGGVNTFRIPGLAVSPKGTVLAVFDLRHNNSGDLPGNIDVGLKRSTDNGTTWSEIKAIIDYDKNVAGAQGNGVGDPTILVDNETGSIFVAALWSKGNRGWGGSGTGMEPEETGQYVITRSDDDGLTWSEPVSITSQIKDPSWNLLFNGPGAGIQLKSGELVFPSQYRDETGKAHSCFIMSTDHGETWRISQPAIVDGPQTNEAQIAQLSDGNLLLSMRDTGRGGQRVWARYEWNGDLKNGTWSKWWRDLPDPTCQASVIRHPNGTLFFANPASSKQRKDFTVRSSTDDGKTWNAGRLLDARPSGYSCLAVLKDGSLGVLYETGDKDLAETLTFARFSPDWVTSVK